MTDESLPPFPTRRQLREEEAKNQLVSRRDLRDAADTLDRDKAAATSAAAQPESRQPAPPSRRDAPGITGALTTISGHQQAGRSPVAPGAPAEDLPVASVVEYDSSLGLVAAPLGGLVAQPPRKKPPPTTYTFPVTIAPRAKLSRPVDEKTGAQRALTWAVMVAAPLLFIGVSMPVNLFYTADDVAPAIAFEDEVGTEGVSGQAFIVDSAEADFTNIARESWSVTSYADVLRTRYGGRSYNYSVSQGGAVRWPFPVAVPISSGFGTRVAPCRYCSSYHRGVDFVPGNGSPTYAMADGVVTQSEFSGGYGQHVYIEHRINGQNMMTVYAHLQRNSSPLRVGDTIQAGEFIGLVGNTGTSTGPHLHFEVRVDGVYIDPFAFLTSNAG